MSPRESSESKGERERQIEERAVWVKETEQPRLDQRPDGPPDEHESEGPQVNAADPPEED